MYTNVDWLSVYSCTAVTAAMCIIAARTRHVRKCLISLSQDRQCPTRSAEQNHGRLHCLHWTVRVLKGCNKEGARGRHVLPCAAWLCLVCQASRPRRTLRSSTAVNVSIQTSFEPSLSSFCDFPTSHYLPVLPSDPGRWRSHLCCVHSGTQRRGQVRTSIFRLLCALAGIIQTHDPAENAEPDEYEQRAP